MVRALRTSLTIAVVSALIATVIGTLSAIAMTGARPAVRTTFEILVYMAIIVPGIVIGISTLIFAVTAFDLVNPVIASLIPGKPPQLTLGLGTVIAAHAMFTSAIVNVIVRTRMAGMDRTLIEASSDLYASPWRTFRQVTIPQLRPAIVAGFLLAFTFSFDDFIVAFFTTGQDQTLPIFLFASIRRGVTPVVNAIATVLLTITVLTLVDGMAGRRAARQPSVTGARDSWVTAPPRTRTRRPLLSDLVRDGLRSAIGSGEFPAGSWLPNESQLCDRFAVSRVTVREAVRVLVEEGYVVRVHGVGTRVAPRPPLRHSLDLNFSYMQLIAAQRAVPAAARCLSAVGWRPPAISQRGWGCQRERRWSDSSASGRRMGSRSSCPSTMSPYPSWVTGWDGPRCSAPCTSSWARSATRCTTVKRPWRQQPRTRGHHGSWAAYRAPCCNASTRWISMPKAIGSCTARSGTCLRPSSSGSSAAAPERSGQKAPASPWNGNPPLIWR